MNSHSQMLYKRVRDSHDQTFETKPPIIQDEHQAKRFKKLTIQEERETQKLIQRVTQDKEKQKDFLKLVLSKVNIPKKVIIELVNESSLPENKLEDESNPPLFLEAPSPRLSPPQV